MVLVTVATPVVLVVHEDGSSLAAVRERRRETTPAVAVPPAGFVFTESV